MKSQLQLPGWHGSGWLKRLASLQRNRVAIVIFVVGPQGQAVSSGVGLQCRDLEWEPSTLGAWGECASVIC